MDNNWGIGNLLMIEGNRDDDDRGREGDRDDEDDDEYDDR
jgi:hypothetical protein